MSRLSWWERKSCTHKKWRPTYDAYAYAPKFELNCIWCGIPMQYRLSVIFPSYGYVLVAYKCPGTKVEEPCGFFVRFRIKGDSDYLKKVIKEYREGQMHFVPIEEFKENEIIKQRLKDLGYF